MLRKHKITSIGKRHSLRKVYYYYFKESEIWDIFICKNIIKTLHGKPDTVTSAANRQ